MLLLLHVVSALASPALLLVALVSRLRGHDVLASKLVRFSNAITAVVVASGTALVLLLHRPLLGACAQGLAYLSLMGILYLAYRLSPQHN